MSGVLIAALLYQELLRSHPIDQLLALSILLAVGSIPLIVRVGSSIQRKRTQRLRAHFGPEYERCVNKHGDWRKAEAELLRKMPPRQPRQSSGSDGGTDR